MRGTVGQYRAQVEHHHPVTVGHHESGVVLDEEHRATGGATDVVDELAQALDLLAVEAGSRLVEEQQRRRLDRGPGELDHSSGTDGQGPGKLGAHGLQPAPLDGGVDQYPPFALPPTPAAPTHQVPEDAPAAAVPLGGRQHIVLDRQPAVGLDPLEGPAHPEAAALHRVGATDVASLQVAPGRPAGAALRTPRRRGSSSRRRWARSDRRPGQPEPGRLMSETAMIPPKRTLVPVNSRVGGSAGDGVAAGTWRTSTSLMRPASRQ